MKMRLFKIKIERSKDGFISYTLLVFSLFNTNVKKIILMKSPANLQNIVIIPYCNRSTEGVCFPPFFKNYINVFRKLLSLPFSSWYYNTSFYFYFYFNGMIIHRKLNKKKLLAVCVNFLSMITFHFISYKLLELISVYQAAVKM